MFTTESSSYWLDIILGTRKHAGVCVNKMALETCACPMARPCVPRKQLAHLSGPLSNFYRLQANCAILNIFLNVMNVMPDVVSYSMGGIMSLELINDYPL